MLLLKERTLTACRLNGREAVVCAFSGAEDGQRGHALVEQLADVRLSVLL